MQGPVQGGLGRNFIITLSTGIIFGFGLSQVLNFLNLNAASFSEYNYLSFLSSSHLHNNHTNTNISLGNDGNTQNEAQRLYQDVKILCWIMTSPVNHAYRAIHVKRTWGPRCNKLLFMSSAEDPLLPSIALPNVQEGADYLWAKTKEAFKYVYEHHIHEADWFMKADDDTYVVVENLRHLLKDFDPERPIYFGCQFKPFAKPVYMSGGAGYVLSKEALRRFVEDALPDPKICRADHAGAEDAEMGVGVEAGDSRDSLGRHRFIYDDPTDNLVPGDKDLTYWYWKYIFYPHEQGPNCCSDSVISFHYIEPNKLYTFDYLIYRVKPYGI